MAMGLEAAVTVLDKSLHRLQQLDMQFGPTLNTIFATVDALENYVLEADLRVGAVLVPGAATPRLITDKMVSSMKRGSVFVDVSIDQGGTSENTRPTTHAAPVYKMHDVVHYCVTNMPGAVARTFSFARNNATLPFILALVDHGIFEGPRRDPHLRAGLNVHAGNIAHPAITAAVNAPYVPVGEILQ